MSVGKLAKLLLMHLLADVVLDIGITDHNQSRHLHTSIYSRNRRQTTGAIQVSCLAVSSELFYAEMSLSHMCAEHYVLSAIQND